MKYQAIWPSFVRWIGPERSVSMGGSFSLFCGCGMSFSFRGQSTQPMAEGGAPAPSPARAICAPWASRPTWMRRTTSAMCGRNSAICRGGAARKAGNPDRSAVRSAPLGSSPADFSRARADAMYRLAVTSSRRAFDSRSGYSRSGMVPFLEKAAFPLL